VIRHIELIHNKASLRTGALDVHKYRCSDTLIAQCTSLGDAGSSEGFCQGLQPERWGESPSLDMFRHHLDMVLGNWP